MVIYEREDGVYEGCRHNHSLWYFPWKVKNGGFLGIFDDAAGNPVYRFFGDTARNTFIEQCTWGFDLHFVFMKECENLVYSGAGEGVLRPGETYEAEYEIAALKSEESRDVINKAVILPLNEQQKRSLDLPVYKAGINRFDRGMDMTDMHSLSWENSGEGAVWDKTFGYDDMFSLKLECKDGDAAVWSRAVGPENFMEALKPGVKYRLSAFVFVKEAKGKGLKMGVGFGVPKYPGRSGEVFPVEYTWAETGRDTGGWLRSELITPEAPEGAIWAGIVFQFEGKGCAWIDNVEFDQFYYWTEVDMENMKTTHAFNGAPFMNDSVLYIHK